MNDVGDVIRRARSERGWGQRRLAEVSGVPQPNIAAIETGARVPSLAMVHRLVRACGLQLRYDLEPRHADVDAAVSERLDRSPLSRLDRLGLRALNTVRPLLGRGARLVAAGPLAAALLGAPVVDGRGLLWCHPDDLARLRTAVARSHLELFPVRPRHDDLGRLWLAEGDEVRVGGCLIGVGRPPPAPWTASDEVPLPVVGIDALLAYPGWSPADRVAVQRLAVALADRGGAGHGLRPVDRSA